MSESYRFVVRGGFDIDLLVSLFSILERDDRSIREDIIRTISTR